MRFRLVRNLRRGDMVIVGPMREVMSIDTADAPGYYGVTLRDYPNGDSLRPYDAVWPGDDLVELA